MLLGGGVSLLKFRLDGIVAYLNEGFYINLPAGAIVAGFLFFIHIPRPKHQVPIT